MIDVYDLFFDKCIVNNRAFLWGYFLTGSYWKNIDYYNQKQLECCGKLINQFKLKIKE